MNPRAAAISRLPFVSQLVTTKLARAIDDARPRGDIAKAITTERSKMKRSRS
jgi:hypothetical protein